jgi:hypothetical protein
MNKNWLVVAIPAVIVIAATSWALPTTNVNIVGYSTLARRLMWHLPQTLFAANLTVETNIGLLGSGLEVGLVKGCVS